MKRITTRIAVLMIAAMAVNGCGILKKGTPKTPVLGNRVSVLTTENDVTVDQATAALPMVLPAPVVNTEWGQPGGNASKSMGHLALGNALTRAWTTTIGRGWPRSPAMSWTSRGTHRPRSECASGSSAGSDAATATR